MGDSRRFDLFAKLISEQFPNRDTKIADVAGGKGYLALCLKHDLNYKYVETFDPKARKQKVNKITYRMFNNETSRGFDLIVGMHPDEATDVIIYEAAKNKVPFVICPCCVKPTTSNYWGKHKYFDWMQHLKEYAENLGFIVQSLKLKMNGKSLVFVGRRAKR